MKTKTTYSVITAFTAVSLLFSIKISAQTMYGLTSQGGDYLSGTIFSVTPNGDLKTFASLNSTYAADPTGSLLYASDGNFYASSVDGGYADSCTIFRCSPNRTLTTMINLDSVWGSSEPEGNSLIQAMDGNLYGMTTYGGPTSGAGVLFELQLNGHYSALHFFNDSNDGGTPHGSLIQTADGMLWGMTTQSTLDSTTIGGTIFHCTTSGVFTSVFIFNDSTGEMPYGDLLLANDGNFYGLTSAGGKYGAGTLFRYTPSGAFTKLVDFNGFNGSAPYGSLIQGTDGKLYGLTSGGGDSSGGTLFVCTLSGSLTTLINLGFASTGSSPMGTLAQASDGNLYGMTFGGGVYNMGTVFQYSLSSGYKKLVDFSGETGYYPMYGRLIEVDDMPSGLKEITNANNTELYPNPNNGSFTLAFSQPSGQAKVEVYNMLGSKVYDGALTQIQHSEQINMGNQPNGVYLYRVMDENGNLISNGKFVIQK